MISKEAFRKLSTYFKVFPAFIDILRSFGEKTNFEDDSYSAFRFQENELSESFGKSAELYMLS